MPLSKGSFVPKTTQNLSVADKENDENFFFQKNFDLTEPMQDNNQTRGNALQPRMILGKQHSL